MKENLNIAPEIRTNIVLDLYLSGKEERPAASPGLDVKSNL